jgi:anti-sigma regulatory factor (Ser/Thr protein kinase)
VSQSDQVHILPKRLLIAQPGCGRTGIDCTALRRDYTVDCVDSSGPAADLINRHSYDLLLADTHLVWPSALSLIAEFKRKQPHARIALLAHADLEGFFSTLRVIQVHNVIAIDNPLEQDLLFVSIENMLFPERAFGLARYLREPGEIERHVLHTREEKDHAIDEAMHFFRRFRHLEYELNDLRLAIEELINNSLYHAFSHAGETKYRAGAFSGLGPGETITMEYGRNNLYVGCAVRDNQGSLRVDRLMTKLERQISLEGLLDESGRGMFLVRTVCDQMIVNVDPGIATEVVLLFAHQPVEHVKSLQINLVEKDVATPLPDA